MLSEGVGNGKPVTDLELNSVFTAQCRNSRVSSGSGLPSEIPFKKVSICLVTELGEHK
jgi:hypothetical protein